jgi:hypothetical protein
MYWPDEIEGGCCWYWSSSPVEDLSVFMWFVSFAIGHVFYDHVNFEYLVRCVR